MCEAVCNLLRFKIENKKGRFIMKKIISLALALTAAAGCIAFAAPVQTEPKTVLMCYDNNGALVYSKMYKAGEEILSDLPEQYKDTKKKVYLTDTNEIKDFNETPSETAQPTGAPTAKPSQTPKPTKAPQSGTPSIYEKEADTLAAPAVVKNVEVRTNSNNEDVYGLTLLYLGSEITIEVAADTAFDTAPEEYAHMKGKTMGSLEEGDVVVLTSNIAGTRITGAHFIYRPQSEDIATSDNDFGTSFEKLISENGNSVAGKWQVMGYGKTPSKDRYQYAFGIVGKKSGSTLTLINKSGDEDLGIEIDIEKDTIVYLCDTAAKNEVRIGDTAEITTTISPSAWDKTGSITLNDDYSYNYALVRVINGTATEIVVYENYNE